MIAWWWLIPFLLAGGYLGWQIRSVIAERAEYRREEQRDREWDEQHGICRA